VGAVREVDLPPHAVPLESELVRTLRAVYRRTVGGDDTPRRIAGATYARAAGNVVAFGPLLPGRPETAHGPDEHIRLDDLLLLARIYARAIYALAGDRT
jgi:succinyl-diaminopimelate desuccinylase